MADEKTMPANLEVVDIRPLIHEIRGRQVMLDRDLAVLYGVEVKSLNQAVKRNLERFPDDFMFQVSREECLRSQIVTLKMPRGKHVKYLPYAFTESGIAMLSGILRSSVAVAVNIRIMRAFVSMRKAMALAGGTLTRLEEVERRQISDQVRNETRFDEIFAKMAVGEIPDHQIFYQGKFWEAKSLLVRFIRRAKRDLVVVDAYVDVATLDLLAKRSRGVKIELVTHSNGDLAESDFQAFGRQYGHFTKTLCGICHDRYIVVDHRELYSVGASLKDAGRLVFGVSKMGPEAIPGLLAAISKAATSRTQYS